VDSSKGEAASAPSAASGKPSSTSATTTSLQPITPLPKKQMSVLTVVLMTESLCSTMLLPFVPRLIAYLKHITVEEAGYYTGILVGLFMLGQVVSSKLWGYMSDAYGRKVPLTAGLLAGAFAMLFFGYTKSFIVCCVLRFLHGFFNGNTLVAKTMIADITDRTNEAQGFALVSITWGVGTLFGPFIGGFLYNPVAKGYLQWLAGGSLRSFFVEYPAFLPSFTIFLYSMVALLFCVLLLRETNPHRKHLSETKLGGWVVAVWKKARGADSANSIVLVVPESEAQTPSAGRGSPSMTSLNVTKGSLKDSAGVVTVAGAVEERGDSIAVPASSPVLHRKLTYMQAMHIGALRNITLFYMLIAASDMTYGEILPLWGNADGGVGGMGLTENAVAMLMLSYSIPSIIANLYFHHMCHFFHSDYLVFWRYSLLMYTVATLAVPLGSVMGGGGYYFVMLLGMVRQIGLSWCYSLIHMLTAKAAPLGCVGSVYGISQSLAGATRCAVPFVVAPLFAWSLLPGHVFPFNYYLVFLVSAVPAAASVCMSFYVEITRGPEEECDLDLAADAALQDDAYDPGASHYRHPRSASERDGEGSEGVGSAYISLASSFCTNPLHDTYVNMSELERENAAAARKLRGERVTECAADVHAQTQPASHRIAREDARLTIDNAELFLSSDSSLRKE
jgi:MFS family permease